LNGQLFLGNIFDESTAALYLILWLFLIMCMIQR